MPSFIEKWRGAKDRTWLVLFLSVCLNIFLIAVIGGHLLHRFSQSERPGVPALMRALERAEANLSPSDAAAFDGVVRKDLPRYVQLVQDIGNARRELEKRIAAEPYDEAAVKQAFAVWRDSWNHFLDAFGNTLVDALGKVSPEGRHKIIENRHYRLAPISR